MTRLRQVFEMSHSGLKEWQVLHLHTSISKVSNLSNQEVGQPHLKVLETPGFRNSASAHSELNEKLCLDINCNFGQ